MAICRRMRAVALTVRDLRLQQEHLHRRGSGVPRHIRSSRHRILEARHLRRDEEQAGADDGRTRTRFAVEE